MQPQDIKKQVEYIVRANPDRVDEVVSLAAGNPFYARELALTDATGQPDPSGRSLSDVVRLRADSLASADRHLLNVVAVAGAPVSLLSLARILNERLPKLMRGISALIQLRLIKEEGAGVTMAHEITRQAFYEVLSEPTRRTLHGAMALALEEEGQAPFLALHFAAAGMREPASKYSTEAASNSRKKKAFLEELRWLLLALDNTDVAIAETLERVVDRMFELSKYAEAAGLLSSYSRHLTPTLRVKADLVHLKLRTSDTAPYRALIRDCNEVFDRAVRLNAGAIAIEALREKMRFAQEAVDTETTLAVAEDLAAFGEKAGDSAIRTQALAISLMKLTSFKPLAVEERLATLRGSVTVDLPSHVHLAVGVTEALNDYAQGRMKSAGKQLHALVRVARASGNLGDEVRVRTLLVPISTELGRFRRAERHAQFVFTCSGFLDAGWENLMTLTNLATCYWEEGHLNEARVLANSAVEAEREYPMWLMGVHPLAILGLCAWSVGDFKEAARYRDEVLERLVPPADWIGDMSQVVALLVRMLERHNRIDDAAELLTVATSSPRGFPKIYYWQVALERLRLGLLDTDEAVHTLRTISEEAERGSCRLITAKVRRLLDGGGAAVSTM